MFNLFQNLFTKKVVTFEIVTNIPWAKGEKFYVAQIGKEHEKRIASVVASVPHGYFYHLICKYV